MMMLLLLPGEDLGGQARVSGILDMGVNQVSDGFYLVTGGLAQYEMGKYKMETGIQVDLVNRNGSAFSGLGVSTSRQLTVKDFPFEIQGFFLWNSHADLLNETNWGIMVEMKWPHIDLSLGNEFRSFTFRPEAVERYGIQEGEHIRENWNLVYNVGYHLKSSESKWDLGLAVTNLDHFLINQETNPFFKLAGTYGVGMSLDLFIEAWYQSAGAFNLSVNYFGFFIRTGIAWDIR